MVQIKILCNNFKGKTTKTIYYDFKRKNTPTLAMIPFQQQNYKYTTSIPLHELTANTT